VRVWSWSPELTFLGVKALGEVPIQNAGGSGSCWQATLECGGEGGGRRSIRNHGGEGRAGVRARRVLGPRSRQELLEGRGVSGAKAMQGEASGWRLRLPSRPVERELRSDPAGLPRTLEGHPLPSLTRRELGS